MCCPHNLGRFTLHGRLPAFSGAVDAFERARKCFLEWRYFFSIILSEFLKNRVALHFPCEVDVLLTNDENIHQVNLDMRNVDRATDVLSFPEFDLTPGELPGPEDADPGTGLVPLGDMVISMEHVAAQAKEYGHSNRRELAYLVVHSVLHLLGYDHLDEGPQKKQMRAREEAILAELGITRED